MDRVLLSTAEQHPTETTQWQAQKASESLGFVVSVDAFRNRLKRIQANIAADAAAPRVDDAYQDWVTTDADEFVGFRIAFFDIETTALTAMMGRVLAVSISDSWCHFATRRITDFPQTSIIDDSGVVAWAKGELEKYDILCGWNSKMFDVPLLNARLMYHGLPPIRSDLMHVDPMWRARPGGNGARIGSSKLMNVGKFFNLPEQKDDVDWTTWQLAATGDDAALADVVAHCEADVLLLRAAFHRLKPLIHTIHR